MYYIIGCLGHIGSNIPLVLLFTAKFNLSHLLLFDALIDLGRRLLVGSKQADDAGPLRVQNIPVLISHHLIQLQDPAMGRGRDKTEWRQPSSDRQQTLARIHTCCRSRSWRWLSASAPWTRHWAACQRGAGSATPLAHTSASGPASLALFYWPRQGRWMVLHTDTHACIHVCKGWFFFWDITTKSCFHMLPHSLSVVVTSFTKGISPDSTTSSPLLPHTWTRFEWNISCVCIILHSSRIGSFF